MDLFTIAGYPYDPYEGQPDWHPGVTPPSQDIIDAVQALDGEDHLHMNMEVEPRFLALKALLTAPQWLALKAEQKRQICEQRVVAILANPYIVINLASPGTCGEDATSALAQIFVDWPMQGQ